MDTLGLPYETYKLAFTPGLLNSIYKRDGQDLLPVDSTNQLRDEGGYNLSNDYKAQDWFPNTDPDNCWWIPSGQQRYSPADFYQIHKVIDPFGAVTQITYDDYKLLLKQTVDALDNTVTAELDYRMLQPHKITDPNGNRTRVSFDALGMVVGTAVMGKPEDNPPQGDFLDASFKANLSDADIDAFYGAIDPHVPALNLLKGATTRIVYDMDRFHKTRQAYPEEPEKWEPAFAATLARETHVSDLKTGEKTKIQISFSYSDGFGREIQKKIQAEDGPLVDGGPIVSLRWIGSGWTIFNNKGKPVRQYESFFSQLPEKRHRFEFGVKVGVSPILFYDPVERVVATLHPNHTYDVNDTVAASGTQTGDPRTDPGIAGYVHEYFETQPATWQTWHAQRIGNSVGDPERTAAQKAAAHADTPTVVHFDALGRPFLTIAHNKVVCPNHALDGTEDKFHTRVELDVEGNQRAVRDAIVQNGDAQGRVVMRYDYDMLGNRIHQFSMEAGARWMLNDVTGNPIRAWDSRGHTFRIAYDQLRRPIESYLSEGAEPVLVGQTVYGETQPNPEVNNLRGQVVQLFDQAGVVTSDDYDFKGNLLSSRRQLAQAYKITLDWSAAVPLEAATYTSRTRYDGLNRPIQLTAPHSDQPGTKINVIQPGYNEANLLEQVNVWLNQNAEPTDLLDPSTANLNAVTDIDYDAKGQCQRIDYDNGVSTFYDYEPLTFRLVHLLTRRNATDFAGDCPQPYPVGWPGCQVQNLHYTYDPAGNITHIRDEAQQIIYFKNKRVEPSADYTYDAIYRLIEATGREHLGQGNKPIPHSHDDAPHIRLPHPGDGNAMGTYIERYLYDAVGNFLEMQHGNSGPAHGWTRTYAFDEASLIEPAKQSNRLSSTTIGVTPETYSANGAEAHPMICPERLMNKMKHSILDSLFSASTSIEHPVCLFSINSQNFMKKSSK